MCFAVLWVFLTKLSERALLHENCFKEPLEKILARGFFQAFSTPQWDLFAQERETVLLISAMLVHFFVKNSIERAQSEQVFAYMMD